MPEVCDGCGHEGPTAEWLAHDLCGHCLRLAQNGMPDQHPDENGTCTCTHGDDVCPYHEALYPQKGTIKLWRFIASGSVTYRLYKPSAVESIPGVWRSQAEDALLLGVVEAAERARADLIDMTFVGITIDKAPYPTNEAKIRNLACQAFLRLRTALDAWRPTDG